MNKIAEKTLLELKKMLEQSSAGETVDKLDDLIRQYPQSDELLYMRGNAKRKKGEWAEAINDYLAAAAINSDSPAAEAAEMLGGILEFRNKDLYNQ